jgi:hypothetical protein
MTIEVVIVLIRNNSHLRVTRALRPLFLLDTYYFGGVRRYKYSSSWNKMQFKIVFQVNTCTTEAIFSLEFSETFWSQWLLSWIYLVYCCFSWSFFPYSVRFLTKITEIWVSCRFPMYHCRLFTLVVIRMRCILSLGFYFFSTNENDPVSKFLFPSFLSKSTCG